MTRPFRRMLLKENGAAASICKAFWERHGVHTQALGERLLSGILALES